MEVQTLPIKTDSRVSPYSAHFTRQGEKGKSSSNTTCRQAAAVCCMCTGLGHTVVPLAAHSLTGAPLLAAACYYQGWEYNMSTILSGISPLPGVVIQ